MREPCSLSKITVLWEKGWGTSICIYWASVLLTKVPLWTLDQKLNEVAVKLRLAP